MNIDKLRKQLELDEGVKYEIYLDHLGYPTMGIGHLILQTDEEFGKKVGTRVSKERVEDAFAHDVKSVVADCNKLYSDFETLPEEVQLIISNMMFNLGLTRLSKFRGMKDAVDDGDWALAADEMVDSNWYRQVTSRAERLVQYMRGV